MFMPIMMMMQINYNIYTFELDFIQICLLLDSSKKSYQTRTKQNHPADADLFLLVCPKKMTMFVRERKGVQVVDVQKKTRNQKTQHDDLIL